MAIPVIMPKQGQSVETCIITKWFIKKGEPVNPGDILFSYETDKAAFDMESPAGGVLLEIFYGDGDEVPVLVNVAVIGNPGDNIEEFLPENIPFKIKSENGPELNVNRQYDNVFKSEEVEIPGYTKIKISPRARKLAEEKGLDYKHLSGSGPAGRILFSDVEKALSDILSAHPDKKAGPEYTEQPLTNIRKLIAKSMHSSLQNSAQLTHHMSADVRKLLETRRKIKEGLSKGSEIHDITLNDMICWCVIKALEKFPQANSHLLDDKIRIFNRVHLGIAVDTQRGLMVPAVKNADEMNLPELSDNLKSLANACRSGNINPELIQSTSSSFTVSNLGNYGVEIFTPVVNLPQTAILGVCTIINKPADLGNNIFGFVPYIGLSLTYDHRAIDGGPATLFLKEIKNQIENFYY